MIREKRIKRINKTENILKRKESRSAVWLLLPSLAGVSVFYIIPFLDVIRRSLYEAMSGQFVGLQNYKTVLNNEAFKQAVKNTARFVMVCIPLLLVCSLILALLLYKQNKYKQFFKTSFLLPMAIPVASVVLLWKLLFHEKGLLNVLLLLIGKSNVDFMNTSKAFYVLVFTYLWKNSGYDMILWLTGLNGIDVSLYEAADVDGANAWAKFRYISLPKLKPTIFMISVLSFINSFKVFREAYLISGDYPQEQIYLLQHIFNNWFISLDIQKMTAVAVLCVILVLVLVFLLFKFDKDDNSL